MDQERLHTADQLEVGGEVDPDRVHPWLQVDMAERRGRTCDTGIANQNVELAVTFVQRRPEPRHAVVIGDVQRHQRRAAAFAADFVVELFQPALGPRHGDDMGTGTGQRSRRRVADAAGRAGDESYAGSERFGHRAPVGIEARGVQAIFVAEVLQTPLAGTSPV